MQKEERINKKSAAVVEDITGLFLNQSHQNEATDKHLEKPEFFVTEPEICFIFLG